MSRIVFLGSGGGGNLKFIYNYFLNDQSVKIVGVITDRQCGAGEFAEINKIPLSQLSFKRSKEENQKLIEILNKYNPEIIVTNIHKILSKEIVEAFNGKLINLHYSYLPAFKGLIGMAPVNEALELNNSFIGTTCHYVNTDVDAGKVICQGIFNRRKSKDIYQTTFENGALTLLNGIYLLLYDSYQFELKFYEHIISPANNKIDLSKCAKVFNELN